MNLARRTFSEFLGTAFLLAVVVGSGIMGERLAGGNIAVALLANAQATGAGLIFLILSFGRISGAHFNPVVTLSETVGGKFGLNEVACYIAAQIGGAFAGVAVANIMFELPAFFLSTKIRSGSAQFLSEFIATFGLIAVIKTVSKFRSDIVYLAVPAYIVAAYWFTSSTSFANPAVTIARSMSDSFAGINPANVPMFISAQILGAFTATIVFNWLLKEDFINE